ncbi:hypothetical protein FSP39_023568 [Pinctada imbricata]|uniref:Uncharacterized protein n=1 Tax=Pinctada imbricata TaxID=66713 RepID=A0AA88Y5E5_PINIB|nr:hypothetical protein FSP39_023568 [Pinctada imbricata]
MKFDDILVKLGEFGFYQKRLYLLLCLPAISVGSFMMSLVLTMETPKHRCKIPGLYNDSYQIQGAWHQDLINMTIPPPEHADLDDYSKCNIYVYPSNVTVGDHSRAVLTPCTEWVYDRSVFKTTFTTKINLVCDDSFWTSFAKMIFYLGVLVGDFLFGVLSDV